MTKRVHIVTLHAYVVATLEDRLPNPEQFFDVADVLLRKILDDDLESFDRALDLIGLAEDHVLSLRD